MNATRLSLAALALGLVAAPVAGAQKTIELTVGASLPQVFAPVAAIHEFVVPEIGRRVAAGGKYRIKWREAYGGQLYKSNATITSLKDGIADLGHVFVTVEGARLPLAQVSSYTPGVTDDHRLVMRAYNELMESYAPLRNEWNRHGLLFLSAQAPDAVHVFTRFPLKTFDDLKNRKISAIGSIGSWLAALGGVPISSPLPTMYNDIKTGLSDGAMSVPTAIASVKVFEVAPHVGLINMGTFNAGALGMNRGSYDKLPREVQEVVLDVGRQYSEAVAKRLDHDIAAALTLFKTKGATMDPPVTVAEFSAAERARMFASMGNVAAPWVKQVEATGAPAREMLSKYMDAVRRLGAKPIRDWDRE